MKKKCNAPRLPEQSEGSPACGKDLDHVSSQHSAKAGRSFTTFRMTWGVTKKSVYCVLPFIVMASLTSCRSILGPDEVFVPTMPIDSPPPPKTRGTVYQAGYNVNMYEDRVARRVGDVLTVRLEEATQGEYRAKTKTDKNARLNYPLPIFFGRPAPGAVVQTNTTQTFDSKGDSNQSNKLSGTISVTIMRVLSNQNLVIQGESWVTINQGSEFVQLSGVVRPEDITPNNTVSSQRIAGAQIKYGARGQAGYATSGGVMTKLFNRFAPY